MGLHELYVKKMFNENFLISRFFGIKVTLRKTGQITVMKETKTFDKEAQEIFVKEVRTIFREREKKIFFLSNLGSSS